MPAHSGTASASPRGRGMGAFPLAPWALDSAHERLEGHRESGGMGQRTIRWAL